MEKFRRFTVFLTEEDYRKFEEMAGLMDNGLKSDLFRSILRAAYTQFEAFRAAHPDVPIWVTRTYNVRGDQNISWLSPWYKPERIAKLDLEWSARNERTWNNIKAGDV